MELYDMLLLEVITGTLLVYIVLAGLNRWRGWKVSRRRRLVYSLFMGVCWTAWSYILGYYGVN